MRLILIGFAATYKTSVGKILAQKLDTQFWDTDLQVEQFCGMSVANIIATYGEQVFRNAESEVLTSLQNVRGVISCGGGATLSPAFANFAQGGVVVWLQAQAQTVRDRLQMGTRPLFDTMTVRQLHEQMENRKPLYQQYATFALSTDGKTSQEVAEEVVQQLAILKGNI